VTAAGYEGGGGTLLCGNTGIIRDDRAARRNNPVGPKADVAEVVADYRQHGITVIALLYKVPINANLALAEGKHEIRLVRSHG
jgi:hypothetical protein